MGTLMKGVDPKAFTNTPTVIPVDAFTQEDRERVLELLLSQERVVTLLYSKVFPIAGSGGNAPAPPQGKGKAGVAGASLEELLLLDEEASERPSTTGGLPSVAGAGGGPSTRPHTLGGGEDMSSFGGDH
jgi:hypothetical protein